MNDNVVVLDTPLQKPDVAKMLAVITAYNEFWEKRTFEFLPLLHESIERHRKGFYQSIEDLSKNSEALAVAIKNEDVEGLLNKFLEVVDDPEEKEFYLEEIQGSAKKIGEKLDVLLAEVTSATKSIASLPVYDAERDRLSLVEALKDVVSTLQLLNDALTTKRNEVEELDKAIEVFELNGIESQFEGQLPSVEQIQGLVTQGATTAGAAVAIEQALEVVNKVLGGIEQGMHYSRLQEQRRSLKNQVQDMVDEQHEQQQKDSKLNSQIKSLEAYVPLTELRTQWLAEKNKILTQMQGERNKLQSLKSVDVALAKQLIKLFKGVFDYVMHIVSMYRKAL
ncbi:MAG: alpha-xenorhabdolysin family binary toxin subunit B [Pseudomonas sp.]